MLSLYLITTQGRFAEVLLLLASTLQCTFNPRAWSCNSPGSEDSPVSSTRRDRQGSPLGILNSDYNPSLRDHRHTGEGWSCKQKTMTSSNTRLGHAFT